ncbi:MAG: UDP-N-acetylmuramoyl-L-alanyl-D-glutamate--2,6-diaminopimelate ligase, partial [Actinobacteria bacterium]|nr:UDP-N-acetylmuramoyl-L-alanyl-D-glutamate--2,6-diaminopimelate ligase [Actinomycetota bacterium]
PAPTRVDVLAAAITGARVVGDGSISVTGVSGDSRGVRAGSIFCCVIGARVDGHKFAQEAVARGAVALVVERQLDIDVPQIVVMNSRLAMGIIASAVFSRPSDKMRVVGVTGTNGKTTTAHLTAEILRRHGWKTDVYGTLSGARTTPEAPVLQEQFAQSLSAGCDAVVMEVSSHALALDRVVGTRFAVGVFTNLGRDHLDFHGTEEQYFAAKAKLFTPELCTRGVVNRDDVHGKLLLDTAPIPMMSFGMADVSDVVVGIDHHAYTWNDRRVSVPLGGRVNMMNSLAAASAAVSLGVDDAAIVEGLSAAHAVPGRYQSVENGRGISIIVDYAHTPEAIAGLLEGVREVLAVGARVIVVFGCGGDRDRDKRPLMGRSARQGADVVVITSDNPRSEAPQSIIDGIVSGIGSGLDGVHQIVDRREAIEFAIREARPGDAVVIAGKGHESTQTIGETVVDFDDVLVAREIVGGNA